jgi:hypothetical protein
MEGSRTPDEEAAIKISRKEGKAHHNDEDDRNHESSLNDRSGGNARITQGQQIVGESRKNDEAAADAEQYQAERLKDQNQGQDSNPNYEKFQTRRRGDRHALDCRPFIHERTAFPA